MNSQSSRSPIVGSRRTGCQQFAPCRRGDTGRVLGSWRFSGVRLNRLSYAVLMQTWRLALLVGVICLAGVSLQAQTNTGEIGGVVKDSNDGVLQGATVVARHA